MTAVADVAETVDSFDELDWYGFDPQAPHASDDGLSAVVVDDIEIPDDIARQLSCDIKTLGESNSFGIDLYLHVLEIMNI